VLDNSVTMRWFFGDGKPQELAYAGKVLDAMKQDSALVPVTWGLEVANVIARAEAKALVTEARSGAFLEMLECVDIEVDEATFAHALSDTLQLARRWGLLGTRQESAPSSVEAHSPGGCCHAALWRFTRGHYRPGESNGPVHR